MFRVPTALLTNGLLKNMKRDALLVLLVDCCCIDNGLAEANQMPIEAIQDMTGLTVSEIELAQRDVARVMMKINTGDVIADMIDNALADPNVPPSVVEHLERLKSIRDRLLYGDEKM